MTKAESNGFAILVIVGLAVFLAFKFVETVGGVVAVLGVLGVFAVIAWSKHSKKQKRLAYLRGKYADEEIVQRIFNKNFWQGQTSAQLQDSLGMPVDIDHKLLKTKSKDVWKYHHRGANRYGLRITLENDVVVGWDLKA